MVVPFGVTRRSGSAVRCPWKKVRSIVFLSFKFLSLGEAIESLFICQCFFTFRFDIWKVVESFHNRSPSQAAFRSVFFVMPKTIAFASRKGGVGKTSLAVNLAAISAERGRKTL